MLERQNFIKVSKYLDYLKEVMQLSESSVERYRFYLRHLLLWAGEIDFSKVSSIRPAFPKYVSKSTDSSNASSLALSSTNKVNILAPLASTAFAQGTVDGLLVVGDLSGGGHVMGGTFNAHAIPDPTTVVLLGLGGVVLLGRRKRLLNRHTA